ncbi:hypothetical protein Pfo_015439 [Paulownia fortunei]|nr:hypothetical protein Pfo_015439 [Paulownia fortunei]
MLEEYLTFFDPSMMLGSEDLISDQALLPPEELNDGTEQSSLLNGQPVDSNFQYPFIKQASQMLGSIPAPPAFAAEFPSKDAALRLNSLSQPSSSVHVTAGMIQIRNLTTDCNGGDQSLGKPENFNIILSFGFSRGDDGSASLESSLSILPGKTVSTLSRVGSTSYFFGS